MKLKIYLPTKSLHSMRGLFEILFERELEPQDDQCIFDLEEATLCFYLDEKMRNNKKVKLSLSVEVPVEEILQRVEFYNYRNPSQKIKHSNNLTEKKDLLSIVDCDGREWQVNSLS